MPWLACLSEKLTDFARLHGHLRIPVTGPWALTAKRAAWVRQQHRAGRLTNDIMSQLERVPGWAWEPRETAFAQGLQAFRAFSRREGHGRVPEGHRESGVYLLPWVRRSVRPL